MAVTQDRPAPYAPASAILSLIERHRNRGLPSPIDSGVLERAGVSASLIPRTLQALQTLDLIGEDGRPSEVLEGIRLAPQSEYKKHLADWLTDAYADALSFVDPATATETEIRDAFRKYTPTGQQDRMVSLFMGLFTAADVMPERARIVMKKQQPSGGGGMRMARVISPPLRRKPEEKRNPPPAGQMIPPGLPPSLAGLLQSMPSEGQSWPQEKRDKFMDAFGVLLDFCFPIGEPTPEVSEDENGD
jgi:hypothetical protein